MTNLMLIGSRAMQYWYPSVPLVKEDTDFDILGAPGANMPDLSATNQRIERHTTLQLNNLDVLHDLGRSGERIAIGGYSVEVCRLEMLCMIKRSHLHRPHKFARNMWLYQQFPADLRAEVADLVDGKNFLSKRIKLTKDAYGDRVPSLNQTNEDFFDDAVTKHFVHDDLHIEMAHYDQPLYERMKINKSLARCERHLWDKFDREDKLKCVLEECYVIGLERFIIPSKIVGEEHMPCKFAALKALDKVCTTLCSGWFRDFAIDNYVALIARLDDDHMNKFFESDLWNNREANYVG